MRICCDCGAKNEDNALFCAKCGHEKFRIPTEKEMACEKETAWDVVNSPINYVPKSSGLFKNAGAKLKALAKISFVISLIIGEIIGIVVIASGDDIIIIGVTLVIISPLLAWMSSIILYAFGELCENVNDIRYYASQSKQK